MYTRFMIKNIKNRTTTPRLSQGHRPSPLWAVGQGTHVLTCPSAYSSQPSCTPYMAPPWRQSLSCWSQGFLMGSWLFWSLASWRWSTSANMCCTEFMPMWPCQDLWRLIFVTARLIIFFFLGSRNYRVPKRPFNSKITHCARSMLSFLKVTYQSMRTHNSWHQCNCSTMYLFHSWSSMQNLQGFRWGRLDDPRAFRSTLKLMLYCLHFEMNIHTIG